eukprot:Em0008g535a
MSEGTYRLFKEEVPLKTVGEDDETEPNDVDTVRIPPSVDPYDLQLDDGRNVKARAADYESLDYDTSYNVPYKQELKKRTKFTYWQLNLMRWVTVGIIGAVTGLVAFTISIAMRNLSKLKYTQFKYVVGETVPMGLPVLSLFVLIGFNALYGLIAAVLTALEPIASGSGVPEIKCYLNGVKVPGVTKLTAFLVKAIGLVFSTAAGFLVGQEGPLVYIGGVIGAGISQFQVWLPIPKRLKRTLKLSIPYDYFRSDREKRDFISSGAAAGVAAAFGSPIGGTLFSLEEGSSFWNQGLTWRTLFCSFCATFVYNFFKSVRDGDVGFIGKPGVVNFGVYDSNQQLWKAYHLIIFIIMGAIGGLIGALFNSLNTHIAIHRSKFLLKRPQKQWWRAFEAFVIIMATTLLAFFCCMFLSTCVPDQPVSGDTNGEFSDVEYLKDNTIQKYFCPPTTNNGSQKYHNDIATIIYNPSEISIAQLYHFEKEYTLTSLGIAFLLYYLLVCWTLGVAVPSGLFVPGIFVGALYGRFFVAIFQQNNIPFLSRIVTEIYPGTYALIGSAAFLGGVMRMTISLTVILIETTQQISYGLPIMITLVVAKWVGDLFNDGIYHIGIHLKKIPFLDERSPEELDGLLAEDIMGEHINFLYPITRVGSVFQLLKNTHHSAYPVVTPLDDFVRPTSNVSDKHTPALYGAGKPAPEPTSLDASSTQLPKRYQRRTIKVASAQAQPLSKRTTFKPRNAKGGENQPLSAELNDESGLNYAYPIPSSGKELQTSKVEVEKPLILHGFILRSQLLTLLKYKAYFSDEDQPEGQLELTHKQMTGDYPRYAKMSDLSSDLTNEEKNMLMDMTLYMNPCPYTISNQAPLPQVFTLFRTMGLRHLPVVKASGVLVGIITRHDLAHHKLHHLIEEKKHKKEK